MSWKLSAGDDNEVYKDVLKVVEDDDDELSHPSTLHHLSRTDQHSLPHGGMDSGFITAIDDTPPYYTDKTSVLGQDQRLMQQVIHDPPMEGTSVGAYADHDALESNGNRAIGVSKYTMASRVFGNTQDSSLNTPSDISGSNNTQLSFPPSAPLTSSSLQHQQQDTGIGGGGGIPDASQFLAGNDNMPSSNLHGGAEGCGAYTSYSGYTTGIRGNDKDGLIMADTQMGGRKGVEGVVGMTSIGQTSLQQQPHQSGGSYNPMNQQQLIYGGDNGENFKFSSESDNVSPYRASRLKPSSSSIAAAAGGSSRMNKFYDGSLIGDQRGACGGDFNQYTQQQDSQMAYTSEFELAPTNDDVLRYNNNNNIIKNNNNNNRMPNSGGRVNDQYGNANGFNNGSTGGYVRGGGVGGNHHTSGRGFVGQGGHNNNNDEGGLGFLGSQHQQQQPLTAENIRGHVYEIAKYQHGCRLLQRAFDFDYNPEVAELIMNEIVPYVSELMMDQYANFLVQKLFDIMPIDIRYEVARIAAPHIADVAVTHHGTFSVQKLIETVASREEMVIVRDSLAPHVVRLIMDPHGNHVIQKVLQRYDHPDNQFIYDAVSMDCARIATNKQGCCVLQRCLEFASLQQRQVLINTILNVVLDIVQDPFGNYVLQYILENVNNTTINDTIANIFLNHLKVLAVNKFSSNVIEKILRGTSQKVRDFYCEALADPLTAGELLADDYGNYVIQTALTTGSPAAADSLIRTIRPLLQYIRNAPYAKKLEAKIEALQKRQMYVYDPLGSPDGAPPSTLPPNDADGEEDVILGGGGGGVIDGGRVVVDRGNRGNPFTPKLTTPQQHNHQQRQQVLSLSRQGAGTTTSADMIMRGGQYGGRGGGTHGGSQAAHSQEQHQYPQPRSSAAQVTGAGWDTYRAGSGDRSTHQQIDGGHYTRGGDWSHTYGMNQNDPSLATITIAAATTTIPAGVGDKSSARCDSGGSKPSGNNNAHVGGDVETANSLDESLTGNIGGSYSLFGNGKSQGGSINNGNSNVGASRGSYRTGDIKSPGADSDANKPRDYSEGLNQQRQYQQVGKYSSGGRYGASSYSNSSPSGRGVWSSGNNIIIHGEDAPSNNNINNPLLTNNNTINISSNASGRGDRQQHYSVQGGSVAGRGGSNMRTGNYKGQGVGSHGGYRGEGGGGSSYQREHYNKCEVTNVGVRRGDNDHYRAY